MKTQPYGIQTIQIILFHLPLSSVLSHSTAFRDWASTHSRSHIIVLKHSFGEQSTKLELLLELSRS